MVVAQLRDLGVQSGDILLVHTSSRAVRPIDGGPDGVIDALIEAVGPDGTIAMPSWTDEDDEIFDPEATEVDDYPCPAPTSARGARNAIARGQRAHFMTGAC